MPDNWAWILMDKCPHTETHSWECLRGKSLLPHVHTHPVLLNVAAAVWCQRSSAELQLPHPLKALAHTQPHRAAFSFRYPLAHPEDSNVPCFLCIQYFRSWDVPRIVTMFHIIATWTKMQKKTFYVFYHKGCKHILTLGSLGINCLSHAAKSHEIGLYSCSWFLKLSFRIPFLLLQCVWSVVEASKKKKQNKHMFTILIRFLAVCLHLTQVKFVLVCVCG